ncbi:MAG: hypothetical protein M1353_12510 [Nitrospirae bacterium]|nr:hypothetical protein [Nitrospirota bacterium]
MADLKEGQDVQDQDKQGAENSLSKEDQEYDAAWDEAGKGDKDAVTAGLPEHSEGVKDPEKTAEPVSKTYGSVEAMEKAVKDSQAAVTRLAQEKSELQKKLDAHERGTATEKEVAEAKQAVRDAEDALSGLDTVKEAVYADYPELKGVLDPIIEQNRTLAKEVKALRVDKEAEAEQGKVNALRDHFNAKVKPEVLKVHADFDDILTVPTGDGKRAANEEYFKWAEDQRPSLRTAALESNDPQDIIWAVSEFKKFKGTPAAREIQNKEEKDKQNKLTNAQTLRGGSTGFPVSKGKKGDPDDYDSAWDEAGAKLKEQGVA